MSALRMIGSCRTSSLPSGRTSFPSCGLFFGQQHIAELALTEQRDLACFAFVPQYHHVFACLRHVDRP